VLIQYIKSSTWPCVLSSWNSLGREVGPDRPPFHPRWTSLRMTSVPPPPEKARRRRRRRLRVLRAGAAHVLHAGAARVLRAGAGCALQEGASEQD